MTKVKKATSKQCDDLWTNLVKIKAKYRCEYCKSPAGLNSHHIFSRSNRSTRWDDENGVSLCVSHHTFGNFSAHKAPLEFAEWLKEKRGEVWYNALRRKASGVYKPDFQKVKLDLQEKIEFWTDKN